MNWFTLRSRPYPRTQALRLAEEGARICRGDAGEDAETGGGEEVLRLVDSVDLIVDTPGHLRNRNGRNISTVIELYKIYSWIAA